MNELHWVYLWRRLHALGKCREVGYVRDEWLLDTGYCLDRYSIEPEPGVFIRVVP